MTFQILWPVVFMCTGVLVGGLLNERRHRISAKRMRLMPGQVWLDADGTEIHVEKVQRKGMSTVVSYDIHHSDESYPSSYRTDVDTFLYNCSPRSDSLDVRPLLRELETSSLKTLKNRGCVSQ